MYADKRDVIWFGSEANLDFAIL